MQGADRTLEFTWTRAELSRLYRAINRSRLLAVALILLLGVVVWAVVDTAALVALALVLLVLLVVQVEVVPRRRWRTRANWRAPIRVAWTDDRVDYDSLRTAASYKAGSLLRAKELGGFAVGWIADSGVLAVPDRSFASQEAREDFVAVLRSLTLDDVAPDEARRVRWGPWLWLVLVLLLVVAGSALVVVTSSGDDDEQLRKLADAEDLWDANGPAAYEMTYRWEGASVLQQHCVVTVEDGAIARAAGAPGSTCPEPSTMEELFSFVWAALDDGPDRVEELRFDPEDGHLVRFDVEQTDVDRWSITVSELRAR